MQKTAKTAGEVLIGTTQPILKVYIPIDTYIEPEGFGLEEEGWAPDQGNGISAYAMDIPGTEAKQLSGYYLDIYNALHQANNPKEYEVTITVYYEEE